MAVLTGVLRELGIGPNAAEGPVVVGSSMGGFYGQYLARRFRFHHLFLINPALEPWNLLARFLGQSMTTANGQEYVVSSETAQTHASLRASGAVRGQRDRDDTIP